MDRSSIPRISSWPYLTIGICLFLPACFMVGPNYKEPPKKIAEHWLDTNTVKNPEAASKLKLHHAHWWTVLQDPSLTNLIYQGYLNNLSIQIAGVRVLQARAQLAQSVGQLYPQQQALVGNYTYQRVGGSSLQGIRPSSFKTVTLGFTTSWEIDFWGKYRRAIEANNAIFLASLAAYDNVLITLIADIASTYISIRTDEALIKITKSNIALQTMSLNIAQTRFKAGQTSLLDVQQAKTELAQTQASLPQLISDLQIQKDKLAVLLGTTPPEVDCVLGKNYGIPKVNSSVAVNIPYATLAQRPDIHQARLEAIAQNAKIGALKANLFPAFSLAGTFAFAANTIGKSSLSDVFNWSNRTIVAGPGFTWPIFNYGQINNAIRMQDAAFQQALLQYLNLVLQAQQEVQNSITSLIEAKKAERLLGVANNSSILATKLALIRYKEGEANYTTVLYAEQQQLRVQTSLINAQGAVPQALVALYRALGGGWQIRACNDIVPKEIKKEMAHRTNWGKLLERENHMPAITPWQRIKQLYLPSW